MHQAFTATQWEHGTWGGGAGVCPDLLEGVGPAVQRECQQENSKQKMDDPYPSEGHHTASVGHPASHKALECEIWQLNPSFKGLKSSHFPLEESNPILFISTYKTQNLHQTSPPA